MALKYDASLKKVRQRNLRGDQDRWLACFYECLAGLILQLSAVVRSGRLQAADATTASRPHTFKVLGSVSGITESCLASEKYTVEASILRLMVSSCTIVT